MEHTTGENLNRDWSSLKRLSGWLCLDFVNTVDREVDGYSQEWLTNYADLIAWSRHANILTEQQAEELLQEAMARPESAKAVFEEAIALRETIYRIFSAVAANRAVAHSDLATLNTALAEALIWLRVIPTPEGFTWTWANSPNRLDSMLWQVVRSAAELLTAKELSRVRECAGEGCGWIFVDMSRNRSRRWCDMESCGNRTKARRHYERHRKQTL